MKIFRLIALLPLFLFMGCPDSTGPDEYLFPEDEAYVAYANFEQNLRLFNMKTGEDKEITQHPIYYITRASNPGVFIFEYRDNFQNRLYGRCQDGSLIPVPKPVFDDTTSFKTLYNPKVALNWAGHFAFYFMYDNVSKENVLVRATCSDMSAKAFYLNELVKQNFGNYGEASVKPASGFILPDAEGQVTYFVVEFTKKDNSLAWQIAILEQDELKIMSKLFDKPVFLKAIHRVEGIVYEYDGVHYVKQYGRKEEKQLPDFYTIKYPHQMDFDGRALIFNKKDKSLMICNPNFGVQEVLFDESFIKEKFGEQYEISDDYLYISEVSGYILFSIIPKPYTHPVGAKNFIYDRLNKTFYKYSDGYLQSSPVLVKIRKILSK